MKRPLAGLATFIVSLALAASASAAPPMGRYEKDAISVDTAMTPSFRAKILAAASRNLARARPGTELGPCAQTYNYLEDEVGRSWGAVCQIRERGRTATAFLCNDWLIGKFSFTEIVPTSLRAVADFMGEHCPPSG